MCEVLDRIEKKGIAEGIEKGIAEGMEKGRAEGRAKGENTILVLMQKLFAAGRLEDAQKASNDKAYCAKLLAEFGLA